MQKQLMSRPLESDLDEAKKRVKLLIWGNEDKREDILAALIELKLFCDSEYKKLIEADPDYSPSIL